MKREERILTVDFGAFGFRETHVLADVEGAHVDIVAITWAKNGNAEVLQLFTPWALELLKREFAPINAQDATHDWESPDAS